MQVAPNINEEEVVDRAAQMFAELFVMQFDAMSEVQSDSISNALLVDVTLPSVQVNVR